MKFEKRTAEVYLFTDLPNGVWAKFTVDDMGTKGRISIASDHGDWQNGWNACGQGFKQFLCDINFEYAADKFGADRWFDADKTVRGFEEQILLYRRERSIEKENARQLWNELEFVRDLSRESEVCLALERDCQNLMKFLDWMPSLSHMINPHFRRMWEEAWPLLLTELRKEIAGEVVFA